MPTQQKADTHEGYGKASFRRRFARAGADRLRDFASPQLGPAPPVSPAHGTLEPPSVTSFIENDLRYGASIPASMKGCLGKLKKIESMEMHDADSD